MATDNFCPQPATSIHSFIHFHSFTFGFLLLLLNRTQVNGGEWGKVVGKATGTNGEKEGGGQAPKCVSSVRDDGCPSRQQQATPIPPTPIHSFLHSQVSQSSTNVSQSFQCRGRREKSTVAFAAKKHSYPPSTPTLPSLALLGQSNPSALSKHLPFMASPNINYH